MKTMTCKQLGGACDKEFRAGTFEEMEEISKKHGMVMLLKEDVSHMDVMKGMKELMSNPEAMKKWMEGKRKEFEELPEDK